MKRALLASLLACMSVIGWAQGEPPLTRILFIFDASNSMNGYWQNSAKIDVSTRLLSQALDSLAGVDNLQLAMRVYGHEKSYLKGQDCDDTRLHVPFAYGNAANIKRELMSLKPKGTTPIAATLEKAAGDFPPCPTADCRNVIILITDGIEECNGDPCAVSMALQKQGIVLKPFVIGVGLDLEFRESFECMGSFYDAGDEKRFASVLSIVISQALNNTTAQVNLIDQRGKPTETNVPMTFYSQTTGQLIHQFVHTMDAKGNPDTLQLEPLHTYRLVVHTVPQQMKDSIEITPGNHNIIGVPAPQGTLELKTIGTFQELEKLKAIVRQSGDLKTLHIQSFAETQRYIVGEYDLEILTTPRTHLKGVKISQSHTTTVELPQAGLVTFNKTGYGYGSLFVKRGDELEFVANLSETRERETISLMPGDYVSTFRPKQSTETTFTVQHEFKVTAGTSLAVKLN